MVSLAGQLSEVPRISQRKNVEGIMHLDEQCVGGEGVMATLV